VTKEGRWEQEEHESFLRACYEHGEDWDKVNFLIKKYILDTRDNKHS
jgi:hypothetical protein